MDTTEYRDYLKQYCSLVEDPEKRPYFLNDSAAVGFLVYSADSRDDEILRLSLRALSQLADVPGGITKLVKVLGFGSILHATLQRHQGKEDDLSAMIRKLLNLAAAHKTDCFKARNDDDEHIATSASSRPFKTLTNLPLAKQEAQCVTLLIEDMASLYDHRKLTDTLVRQRGVISVAFSVNNPKKCTVRMRPEIHIMTVANALIHAGFHDVYQLGRNKVGNMVKKRLCKESNARISSETESKQIPDYLPEEDDNPPVGDKAVATPGVDRESSLKKTATSVLSSAAKFFTNTFYW